MKSRTLILATTISLVITLTIPLGLAAQNASAQANTAKHHHYNLIDMGTLGGPNSYFTFITGRSLNNHGVAVGGADTAVAVSPPFCLVDCYLGHTFQWQDGVVIDSGALPETFAASGPNDINAKGAAAGTRGQRPVPRG